MNHVPKPFSVPYLGQNPSQKTPAQACAVGCVSTGPTHKATSQVPHCFPHDHPEKFQVVQSSCRSSPTVAPHRIQVPTGDPDVEITSFVTPGFSMEAWSRLGIAADHYDDDAEMLPRGHPGRTSGSSSGPRLQAGVSQGPSASRGGKGRGRGRGRASLGSGRGRVGRVEGGSGASGGLAPACARGPPGLSMDAGPSFPGPQEGLPAPSPGTFQAGGLSPWQQAARSSYRQEGRPPPA